jgi:DnaJ like chaperone protein
MALKFSLNGLFASISKIISEDVTVENKRGKSAIEKAHDDEIQKAILVLASDVIRCNRNLTSETEKFIEQFLILHFGPQGVKQRMKTIQAHLDTGTEPFTRMACQELKLLTTHDSHLSIVGFLLGVAASDDFVNEKELKSIHKISKYLEISERDFKELKYEILRTNSPYAVLEIEMDATIEQVKSAYRKMTLKYHPDKRPKHISEEDANIKFREIQRAFDMINKKLGLK